MYADTFNAVAFTNCTTHIQNKLLPAKLTHKRFDIIIKLFYFSIANGCNCIISIYCCSLIKHILLGPEAFEF